MISHRYAGLRVESLRPYQKQSLAFMLAIESRARTLPDETLPDGPQNRILPGSAGGWLCDEVGMGKTVVCIALILATPPTSRRR